MSDNIVSFDIKKLKRLKKAYREAKEEKFIFEGNEYLVGYAKYLIEYLEGKLYHERKKDSESDQGCAPSLHVRDAVYQD